MSKNFTIFENPKILFFLQVVPGPGPSPVFPYPTSCLPVCLYFPVGQLSAPIFIVASLPAAPDDQQGFHSLFATTPPPPPPPTHPTTTIRCPPNHQKPPSPSEPPPPQMLTRSVRIICGPTKARAQSLLSLTTGSLLVTICQHQRSRVLCHS